MPLNALILDYGNVLSHPQHGRIENIEAAASLGIPTFRFVGVDAVSRLERSVRSLSA